jgi:putative transposase
VRDLIREICGQEDVHLIRGHVSKDHLHLFVSIPPQVTIRRMVQRLKGKSADKLLAGVSALAQKVLGTTPLGTRLLLLQ